MRGNYPGVCRRLVSLSVALCSAILLLTIPTVIHAQLSATPAAFSASTPCGSAGVNGTVQLRGPSSEANFWVTVDQPWISVYPEFGWVGDFNQTMSLRLDPYGLPAGIHEGVVRVNTVDDTLEIPVSVVLDASPRLAVASACIELEVPVNAGSRGASFAIQNQGCQPLIASFESGASWLTLPADDVELSGQEIRTVPVIFDVASLAVGTHLDSVVIASNDPLRPRIARCVKVHVSQPNPGVSAAGIAVSELGFRCTDGSEAVQFVELEARVAGVTFSSSLGMRVIDRFGQVSFESDDLFMGYPDGTPWPTGQKWLIGSPAFEAATGVVPDLVIPVRLDPLGGELTLHDAAGPGSPLHRFSWGTMAGHEAPPPDQSLALQADNSMAPQSPPNPENSRGDASVGLGCLCPLNRLWVYSRTTDLEWHTRAPVVDSTLYGSGFANLRYDLVSGTTRSYGVLARPGLEVGDHFVIEGLPAGTPVGFRANMRVTGYLEAVDSYPSCGLSGGASLSARLMSPTGSEVLHHWSVDICSVPRTRSVGGELEVMIDTRAGSVFTLFQGLSAGGGSEGGRGEGQSRLEILGLPPGARLRSCQGYARDVPVPVAPLVVDASRRGTKVFVTWRAPGFRSPIPIERRPDGSSWSSHGSVTPDSDGRIDFVDHDTDPEIAYAYRLVVWGRGVADAWLAPISELAQRLSARSGPDPNEVLVDFRLSEPASVALDVFDITGRLVIPEVAARFSEGPHRLTVRAPHRLSSGMYLLRARIDSRTSVHRILIAR